MSEGQSKRTEIEDASRVDQLLGLLSDLSKRDPSPTLRDELSAIAARRLRENPAISSRLRDTGRRTSVWLRPSFATALLVAVGLIVVALVVHFREHVTVPADKSTRVNHSSASPEYKAQVVPTVPSPLSARQKNHHSQPATVPPMGRRQMTMRLPYSNSAIETGTDTTIRVFMSQSELLSLGFPINATVQERRIVANLTLGDDGLPRAISLPLPLEVMKEKK
jgi:hypothetical protein